MIAVVATGTKNGDLGARREKLIEKTIGVCIDELKLDRFRAVIHVKQTRSKKHMDGWAVGYATMDRVDTNDGKLWWGIIELCNAHPRELVKTLCHEMVHMKQYLRKELSMDGMVWKGKDFSEIPYNDQPCEIEAYDLQEKLYAKCVDLKVV